MHSDQIRQRIRELEGGVGTKLVLLTLLQDMLNELDFDETMVVGATKAALEREPAEIKADTDETLRCLLRELAKGGGVRESDMPKRMSAALESLIEEKRVIRSRGGWLRPAHAEDG